jgi:hypothetical protein
MTARHSLPAATGPWAAEFLAGMRDLVGVA